MSTKTLISIIESPAHPQFSALYQNKGLTETKVSSVRKAISIFKKQPVDYIVAEFFYAYSTNYSGVHKSNLDVLLVSLKKYSPKTKVIAIVMKKEQQYIDVLDHLDYPLHGVLVQRVNPELMLALL